MLCQVNILILLMLGSGIFEDRQADPARAPGITTQTEKWARPVQRERVEMV
jgi:hypothetical protein